MATDKMQIARNAYAKYESVKKRLDKALPRSNSNPKPPEGARASEWKEVLEKEARRWEYVASLAAEGLEHLKVVVNNAARGTELNLKAILAKDALAAARTNAQKTAKAHRDQKKAL